MERANGTIRCHFEKWTFSNPKSPWSRFVPYCERIVNSDPVPNLDLSPNDIVFSRALSRRSVTPITISEHMAQLDAFQAKVVKEHGQAVDEKLQAIEDANSKHKLRVFPPGTLVLVTNPQKKKQFDSYFHIGPLRVVRQDGNKVIVQKVTGVEAHRSVHISRVKLFYKPRRHAYDPDQVHHYGGFFTITSIVGHHTNEDATDIIVTVRWQDEETTDESMKLNPFLQLTKPFQQYCQLHTDLTHYIAEPFDTAD